MVLEVIGALPEEDRRRTVVWLPSDYQHGLTPLCEVLEAQGIVCEHAQLPVVRRKYLTAKGIVGLGGRAVGTRRRVTRLNPSDVFLATSAVLPVAPLLPRDQSTRVVLHMQEVWHGREAKVLGALASRVDRIIAISQASRASLPERLRRRAVVVPNGTADPGSSSPLDDRGGRLTFMIASRWNAWKGHEVLIRAWDEACCPGRLIVVGGPPAMGVAVDVPALVAASSRPESIEVRGEVNDVSAVIDEADVMVVPSTAPEPFGLVTIEAFALGRPVVASATGGSLETVKDGAGWLFTPGNVGELAERLRSLSRDEVVKAGALARRRFERHYARECFRSAMRDALSAS
jgi:glycosyltransferase involved in cell wall biosynthesis